MEANKRSAFDTFLSFLIKEIEQFPDFRSARNTQYSIADIVLSAYSCFHMQNPSFLSHQQTMNETKGKNNAKSFFGIDKIPTDNHLRNILDKYEANYLNPVYFECFKWIEENDQLKNYFGINNNILIALDGTEFFTSGAICCENCSTRKRSNGKIQNFHSALTPAVVAIDNPSVIPLPQEFITPQDGQDKQDCENAAGKRWFNKHGDFFSNRNTTVLGDDLYSKQPLIESALSNGFNYLFVCKYSSHKYLKEWIDLMTVEDLCEYTNEIWTGKEQGVFRYRYANSIPLHGGEKAIKVNWAELTVENKAGKIINRFAFVTNHTVTKENVELMIESGRCRWKIENENNNNLKTKGYHIEHNFGHGKDNLSNFLLSLNILAFLCHNMMDMTDKRYKLLRKILPTRRKFFTDITALTTYLYFNNWDGLLKFMINGLELDDPGG